MVSLARLLAAADDSSQEQPATTSQPSHPARDCVLPPVFSPTQLPPRLRAALSLQNSPPPHPPPALPLHQLLSDLGPEATAPHNMSSLARTLAHFGRPSEAAVASALLFLAAAQPPEGAVVDSHTMFHMFALFCADPDSPTLDPAVQQAVAATSNSPAEWRVDVLVQAVTSVAAQFHSPLDWRLIIQSLDVDGLETQLSQSAFLDIANAYIAGTGGALMPADCIVDNWTHRKAQLCMLTHALSSPEFINWDTIDVFEGATGEDISSPYARVALIEKLVELEARNLLQIAVKASPELVLLSLTCAKPKSNTVLQQKLTVTLLTPLIAIFPSSSKSLRQMWNVTPALVEAGIISMWKKDPSRLQTVLNIGVELHILSELLASGTSIEFALDLAMLAYWEELLQLETWLMEMLGNRGLPAVSLCMMHMVKKVRHGIPAVSAKLSLDAVRIVFRCLITCASRSTGTAQSGELLDSVHDVHDAYSRLQPRLSDLSPAADVGDPKVPFGSDIVVPTVTAPSNQHGVGNHIPSDGVTYGSEAASTAAAMLLPGPTGPDGTPAGFPTPIEKEADIYFEKLYKGELPTEQAVDFLRQLKASNTDHDRRVFNCAMHTLFDEYRFFRKYPDRELKITGMLFGSVIQFSLLSGGMLGLAAKCVLDALKTVEMEPAGQPVGRLTKFGLCALERFSNRLHEWPQYCQRILELPRLKTLAPDLIGEVQKALDANVGMIPSAAEKRIGLTAFEGEGLNENAADGAVPPVSHVRDAAADAESVRALVSSPPLSANITPLKGRSSSSSSLRASPSPGMDGSLNVAAPDLTALLGMTEEEIEEVVTPDETTQDKMKFIFNNLSQTTMDDKVQGMKSILITKYHRFFTVYIVVKRASIEPNFHHLYLTLLEKLAPHVPKLFPMVFDTSYRRVRVLLASEKIVTSSTERLVLKSLGSWIGSLTLARNKPILQRDLDLKELLMDAYSNGRLIAVVPFVAKVLEASQRSKVFKTTNPWIRGILSLMKEIYCVSDLKLNMKFELQLLCKSLSVDVAEVVSSALLQSRPAPDKNNNPDFTSKKSMSSSPLRSSPSPVSSPSPEMRAAYNAAAASGRSGVPVFTLGGVSNAGGLNGQQLSNGTLGSAARQDPLPSLGASGIGSMGTDPVGELSSILASASLSTNKLNAVQLSRSSLHTGSGLPNAGGQSVPSQRHAGLAQTDGTLIPNLAQYITVSPSLVLFQNSPNLKRLLPVAIDRAIKEIIQPVVERSCAIAFLTTKELTLKDFANEPDISKIRRAALQMVQQLAGSLALVTSKEPLRVSMGNQLRSLLTPAVGGDQNLIEQTAQVVCAANLEVGCAVIERHAKEKAARDLNEKIAPAFSSRRPQHSGYNLGLAPGPEVLRVYDEFSRLPRAGLIPPSYSTNAQSAGLSTHPNIQPQSMQSASAMVPPVSTAPSTNAIVSQVQPERRMNGPVIDVKPDIRASSTHKLPRTELPQGQHDVAVQGVVGAKRTAAVAPNTVEPASTTAVYGSALPVMATPQAMANVMLLAAGSSSLHSAGQSQATQVSSPTSSGSTEAILSTQQVLERFNSVYPDLIGHIADLISSSGSQSIALSDVPLDHPIHSLWVQIPTAVKRSVTADEAGMAVAQKVFQRLYDGESSLYHEVHVLLLEGLRESCRRLSKELVSWLAFSEERKKLHRECIVALLKPGSLLNITNYDELLAKAIDNGRNVNALDFACFLVRRTIIDEPLATAAELYLTLEAIAKVGRRPSPPALPSAPEGLLPLVEAVRKVVHTPAPPSAANVSATDIHSSGSTKQTKEAEATDPIGARGFVAGLLLEWHKILASDSPNRPVPEHAVVSFLTQMRASVLNNDDSRERFFRLTIDLVSNVTTTALQSHARIPGFASDLADAPYTAVESTVRLIGATCRPDPSSNSDNSTKGILILSHFLSALVKEILKSNAGTDLRPHFRLFSGVIAELAIGAAAREENGSPPLEPERIDVNIGVTQNINNKADALRFLDEKNSGFAYMVRTAATTGRSEKVDLGNFQVLSAIVGALRACAPLVAPGFAFSWLQLMSSRELLPRLLSSTHGRGWPLFRQLLVAILVFLSNYLSDPHESMTEGIRVLYRGTLRVLLVLLHDFPEFLCDYHMVICDVIPMNCVQLRNLVLAAFPKNMRLPDPFLPELKVDQLPEMASQPRILSDYISALEKNGLRNVLDNLLQNSSFRSGNTELSLESHLIVTDAATGEKKYSIPTISSLVLYVGQHAISHAPRDSPPVMNGPAIELFESLTRELGPEGQYHLFNAITNQLRYPNNHTLYYSRLLLFLFREASHDSVKEQITRVLVERLIANRPHPWGLLITFIELIKNSMYNFWGHGFVRCAPQIEQLFESVAKFCVGPALQNQHQSVSAAS